MNAQLQIFFLMIAGWLNRQHQGVIEYLHEENRILLEQLGGKPRRFTDAQRLRLARRAKPIGRRKLLALGTIVTPDTLLRWFRVLVARKWTYLRKACPGRPSVDLEVEKLVLKLMEENPSWGSDRIVGALANLHVQISDTTVDNIRKRNGIPPAPQRVRQTGIDGLAGGKTHLIIDRDTKYCHEFRQILESAGIQIVLCPPRVPQCNAYAER